MVFNAVAALFAVYMLVRHVPRTVAALRAPRAGDGRRPATFVALLNVVLALAVLVVSVKGLAAALINR